jgi:hypothetical protein
VIEPFNKKGVEVGEGTRFAQDLEWDSLTVMDFVATVEDEFDILISMNRAGRDRDRRPAGRRGGQLQGEEVTDPGIEMTKGGALPAARSGDLFSKFDPLIQQREALLDTGLTDPFNLVMERVESPTVAICNGRARSCSAPTITWA